MALVFVWHVRVFRSSDRVNHVPWIRSRSWRFASDDGEFFRGYLDVSLSFECVFCFPVDWSENQGELRICSLDESERLSLIVHYYVYEPNLLHSIVLSCLNKRLTSLRCCLFRVMHRRCRRQCVLRCTTMQHSSTWDSFDRIIQLFVCIFCLSLTHVDNRRVRHLRNSHSKYICLEY